MFTRTRNTVSKILSAEFWVVFIFVLLGFFIAEMLFITIIVGLSFWILRWFALGRLTIRTPSDWGIGLLVLMTGFTLWATTLSLLTYYQVLRIWSGVIFFYAIVNWTSSRARLRTLTNLLVLSSLAVTILTVVGVDWTFEKLPVIPSSIYQHLPSLLPDWFHRNVMAGYLVLLLPPILGILIFAWRSLRIGERIFLAVAAVLITTVLILTQSRGALIAFGIVIALLITLRWRWGWILLPLGWSAGILIITYLGLNRFLNIISSGVNLGGLEGRLEIWSRAIYMIQDFPVLGIGMGRYQDVVDKLYPFFIQEPGSIPHAHNILLQITVDLGIPGLIAWLSIIIGILYICWIVFQQSKRLKNAWLTGLGVGLLLSQVAILIHGMFDAVTWGVMRVSPIVWMVWAIAAAAGILLFNSKMDQRKQIPGSA
ncbi:MAG: O-antigen ligase family protein [Chloroflexota bacterium]|nr:O-antigen ligase family protein [Chloroflexota bacterium]